MAEHKILRLSDRVQELVDQFRMPLYPITPGRHDHIDRLAALRRPSYRVWAKEFLNIVRIGLSDHDRIGLIAFDRIRRRRHFDIDELHVTHFQAVKSEESSKIKLAYSPKGHAKSLPLEVRNIPDPAVFPARKIKGLI